MIVRGVVLDPTLFNELGDQVVGVLGPEFIEQPTYFFIYGTFAIG
tara:strand:- start:74 stop:208 length:135 start_codon:yes stop_codon:yes gene_type:complete